MQALKMCEVCGELMEVHERLLSPAEPTDSPAYQARKNRAQRMHAPKPENSKAPVESSIAASRSPLPKRRPMHVELADALKTLLMRRDAGKFYVIRQWQDIADEFVLLLSGKVVFMSTEDYDALVADRKKLREVQKYVDDWKRMEPKRVKEGLRPRSDADSNSASKEGKEKA